MTTTENEVTGTGNRWWIGAAVFVGVPLVVLRGVSHAARFGDGFLSHWYGQLAVGGALLAGYALVHWMISRAYRRHRRAEDGTGGVR
jgi:hypothetical protein